MSFKNKIISNSPEETFVAGKNFASELKKNSVVGLFGNLGAGKTLFVKGICHFFNIKDIVNSPTFIIVNEYTGYDNKTNSIMKVNHFDLYRLKNINELLEIGLEGYLNDKSICLIEWAGLADKYLNGNLEKVYFEHGKSENERLIQF